MNVRYPPPCPRPLAQVKATELVALLSNESYLSKPVNASFDYNTTYMREAVRTVYSTAQLPITAAAVPLAVSDWGWGWGWWGWGEWGWVVAMRGRRGGKWETGEWEEVVGWEGWKE